VLPLGSPASWTEHPSMYVSPETLDMHITRLREHFELVHLDDWLRRAARGERLPRLACALTFDDGWRDNLEFALPVLQKHGAPAMVFLVSGYIGSTYRYWPNRLMALLRESFARPGAIEFPQPLRSLVEPVLAEARRRGRLRPEDMGRAVEGAKAFDEVTIRDLVGAAEKGSGEAPEPSSREILDTAEIAQLATTGLVRFGSHTVTHHRLGGHVPAEDLEREILLSRQQLQEICDQPIEVFCYPNGDTSTAAVNVVRRHYMGAVTTQKGWHRASADAHLIRRVGLHDRISNRPESFLARVSAWI
jgi:peptidoglycan/xylan/chitin deacetylase (PgdA/CDA1 family)